VRRYGKVEGCVARWKGVWQGGRVCGKMEGGVARWKGCGKVEGGSKEVWQDGRGVVSRRGMETNIT
jgi:hypothetical protein